MKNINRHSGFWKSIGALPIIALIILVLILSMRQTSMTLESPFLLALLNTIFLCGIPLVVAYMAAKSYRVTGAMGFLFVGCGLVFFGVGSLLAGWVMPLAGNPNPTVTLHNLGSLFAGICMFIGAHFFVHEFVGVKSSTFSILRYDVLYAGIVVLMSITALLAFQGKLPVFFDPLTGPSLLRQLILGGATCMFAGAGLMFIEIYFASKTEFAYWYGLALWLVAIGLACVFLQQSVGGVMGWTGRGAQYLAGVYLIIAFLQGKREISPVDQHYEGKSSMVFWPYLEQKITERIVTLTRMNETLQKEIIARKRAEEALKQYAEELKSSNELKDLFTDILRHDLLNPAGIVKGYTELLLDMEEDEKKQNLLNKVEQSNKKLINMIEIAARFAKLESVEELEFETLDIGAIFKIVVDNFKPKLEENNIILEFVAEGKYPANVNRIIEEVFANLISNAIKYSPEETRIIVDILDAGEDWKVTVTDFGEGISDENKQKIFSRFKRVDKTAVKGTGLGLAIVKRIVDLHGGDVGVEDNPQGRGSVFWVTVGKA